MKRLARSPAQRLRRSAGTLAVTTLASSAMVGALTLASGAAHASAGSASGPHYTFKTLNNQDDPTFNQLLGINDSGKIVGYFGSGAKNHPNKGYALHPPYRQVDYRNQNFPGSKQTQVTGENNGDVTVGFFSDHNLADLADNNIGYYAVDGQHFHKVNFPAKHPASPAVDQLLGVNDSGNAVGFYLDSSGNSHGYLYSIHSHEYVGMSLAISGVTSVTPTGINDADSVTGFYTSSSGTVRGFFVRQSAPRLFILNVPGSSATQPLGVSKHGEVVGFYTVGTGGSAVIHGFTWTRQHGFRTVDDPHGAGTTTINGVNSVGDLVGFYVGSGGNTNGFLAKP
jgi:protein-disulfide isomerase